MKPHKHAELIKAWADGAEIEVKSKVNGKWIDMSFYPEWDEEYEYRIKPEEKKPVVRWLWMTQRQEGWMISSYFASDEEVKSENSPYAWVKLDWSRTEFDDQAAESEHNGIRVTTSNNKTTLHMFLNNKDKTWVEFDKEQLADLIELLQEQLNLLEEK